MEKDDNLPMLKNLEGKMKLEFDYEINTTEMDEDMNCKMYYIDKNTNEKRIVNYNSFWDELNTDDCLKDKNGKEKPIIESVPKEKVKKACCLKSLVSKKKRRLRLKTFDLDMSYISRRVLAMGFPSTGTETLYRNSLKEITRFFNEEHHDQVKIYNLCLEKNRIYEKSKFKNSTVALFPSKDHNPCPIKLILEFCIDICLYLIKNPRGVASVHCKAGKGRTGVMICSYLIFSGLCENSKRAFDHYAEARTKNKKGVTIPSQIRYVEYFESFLETNFYKPYLQLIPKMVKLHFPSIKSKNVLMKFIEDRDYFFSESSFNIREITIGPFEKKVDLKIDICDFRFKNIKMNKVIKTCEKDQKINKYYFNIKFIDNFEINSDIKISVTGGNIEFYIWANLWYSCYRRLKEFLEKSRENEKNDNDDNKKITEIQKISKPQNIELQELNSKNMLMKDKDVSDNSEKFKLNYDSISNDLHLEREVLSEVNRNEKILDNSENKEKHYNLTNLPDLLYNLDYNKKIGNIIDIINNLLKEKGKTNFFKKDDFYIHLRKYELDKFFKVKNVHEDFSLNLKYSLSDKNN